MTWDNIIALISISASFSAIWVSVISLNNSNRIKSYEHMIKQRLNTFAELKKYFAELKLLVSAEHIDLH